MSHSHDPIESRHTVVERDEGTGLGMILGVVLVALLIGAVLWVAFAGAGVTDDATGGGRGDTNSPTFNIEVPGGNSGSGGAPPTNPNPPSSGGNTSPGSGTAPGTGSGTSPAPAP